MNGKQSDPVSNRHPCSQVFHHVPQRSGTFQNTRKCKTNPTAFDALSRGSAAIAQAVAGISPVVNQTLISQVTEPAGGSKVFQDVPRGSGMFPKDEMCKTNPTPLQLPTPPAGDLPARQLSAARLLLQGLSSDRVAAELKTTRQTINRWRRNPLFVAEVRRLNELMARQFAINSRSARVPRAAF